MFGAVDRGLVRKQSSCFGVCVLACVTALGGGRYEGVWTAPGANRGAELTGPGLAGGKPSPVKGVGDPACGSM